MVEESKQNPEALKMIVQGLKDLQSQLEPVRDKALDQKSYYTGYAQCAETFIKIIINRANAIGKMAEEMPEVKKELNAKQLIEEKLSNIENTSQENLTGDDVK